MAKSYTLVVFRMVEVDLAGPMARSNATAR
jgi:hypothetical protein